MADTKDSRSPWSDQDRIQLKQFLDRNPKFLEELRAAMPKVESTSMERAALTGQKKEGAEDIIRMISTLATDETNNEGSPYISDRTEG